MNRRGATLIELVTALTIVGILAGIVLPFGRNAQLRAHATHVVSDFNAVRYAAFENFANTDAYPMNTGWRKVPKELVGTLPPGFVFYYRDVDYRWRRWALPNGKSRKPTAGPLLGLELRSDNAALLSAIRDAFGGISFGTGKNKVTLVIE